MDKDLIDLAIKGVGLIVLVVIVLFIVTWAGLLDCKQIPMWCDVYEAVLGSPRVLVVYGDSGLGDPEALKSILQDPQGVGVNAVDISHVDRISSGNLNRYKLVIVEKARKLSFTQLKMFQDYVQINGGRLVWVGDSGVEKGADELENLVDTNSLKKIADNAWVRVKETETEFEILNFDEFLGLKYVDNYCTEIDCIEKLFTVGVLNSENTANHPLIFGASPTLNFKISKERDFSIVTQFPNASNSNVVLSLDLGGKLSGRENEIPRYVPIITTSGLGERVAYYAYPPEYFVQDNNFFVYIKDMYYGMLGK